ncbi:MAG TPA: hypothetical protein VMU53_11315 [Candidatus Sulfotelmatobacter sp.]|nr:hypothetical protein [Candidatus Sulfotelmatobacter sp.]
MGPISMLFGNPAVKILEGNLWEDARKRYLLEHPSDRNDDAKTIMRKTKDAYKDKVAASLKEADYKVRAKWRQFKHGMIAELRMALATVFRMSEVDWYSVEIGRLPSPEAIAVPYQLLKHMTAALLFRDLRKQIDFEDLDDPTLEALAAYAADQKFQEVLEGARCHYEPIEIGERRVRFVVTEIIERDAYFVGEENHHSLIDIVILSSVGGSPSDGHKRNQKIAVKRWFDQDRKNRRNDRRFVGDDWEIECERLKPLVTAT